MSKLLLDGAAPSYLLLADTGPDYLLLDNLADESIFGPPVEWRRPGPAEARRPAVTEWRF